MTSLMSGTSQLATGASQLDNGLQLLNGKSSDLLNGMKKLSSGSSDLQTGSAQVKSGIGQLNDGAKQLADGTSALKDKNVSGVTDSLMSVLDDSDELKKSLLAVGSDDAIYTNYSGIADGKTGSVKFIIETDAIKTDD